MLLPLRRLMSFSVRSFESPLAVDQVQVSLSSRFNRLVHPDALVEQQKTQNWTQLQLQNPRLFNATKFRLAAFTQQQPTSLQLQWGLTDYASYLGTCCSTLAPQLLADGERLHGDRFAFLSRKVGVAAVLETGDGYVALIKRSKSVGIYQDMYDTPGGHPEPSHIQLTEDVLQTLEDTCNDHRRTQLEHDARREFFQSIVTELHEEVNLDPLEQQPPQLLGVVMQSEACTPSFSFHVKTECSADELREVYRAGPADKFESVKLELVAAEKLLAEGSKTLCGEDAFGGGEEGADCCLVGFVCCRDELQLTPSAKGTLGLWKQHTLRARQQQ